MEVVSVSPSSGHIFGGYEIVIKGSGFSAQLGRLNITLCGIVARILDISNTQIIIEVPRCNSEGSFEIDIQFGDFRHNSSTFDYLPPEANEIPIMIDALVPNSVSPVIKQAIEIHGTGFGTNKSALEVYMINQARTKEYPMKILRIEENILLVGYPGSLSDTYFIHVTKVGTSSSLPAAPESNKL